MDKIKICIFSSILCLLFSVFGFAEDLSLHGFVQANYSLRTASPNPEDAKRGNLIWGDERLQLKASYYLSRIGFFAKSDFYHDWYEGDFNVDFREGYVDIPWDNFGLRAGRQIFTWGVGDLLFINDVFPKDWEAFYAGRPLEYLKIGSDSIKLDIYSSFVNVEAIAIPFFTPDNLPESGRFHVLFEPDAVKPSTTFANTEYAVRFYRNIGDFDVSSYFYKGFYRIPEMISPQFYPELAVYGLSAQRSAFGGVISAEYGYYDSLDNRDGEKPGISNSQSRFLIGYQKEFSGDFTLGLQYYIELMYKYSQYLNNLLSGFPERDQYHQYITLRLTKLLKYQTLKLSLFTFCSPDEEDFFISPEISYNFTDNLMCILGMNIFTGTNGNTTFGQHKKDDNVYITVRYSF